MLPLRLLTRKIDLSALRQRRTYKVNKPDGTEDVSVRCWGLASNDRKQIVVWVFDDLMTETLDKNWGASARSYTVPMKDSKKDHKLIINGLPKENADAAYSVKWYHTWPRAANDWLYAQSPATKKKGETQISIPLGSFSVQSVQGAGGVWDGADMVLVIER